MKNFKKTMLPVFVGAALSLVSGPDSLAGVLEPGLQSSLPSLAADAQVPIIVTLTDKADLTRFKEKDRGSRRTRVIRALKDKAAATQAPVRGFLKNNGATGVKSLWIINGMAATAAPALIRALANRPGVESIRLDDTLFAPELTAATTALPEWNLDAVGAPALWALGHTGGGTVIAGMDTGVDLDHPDIGGTWRGGANSWYDPNGEHDTPFDATGHGTQTMGIMVGGAAGGTAIGMAPGAKWIAVKIFDDSGQASYSDIHLGFQWLLDPDNDPATDDAPNVVNNSWGLREAVNQCVPEFQEDVRALEASLIAAVFSGGNEGPLPSTSLSPANYPESLAVGSVDVSLQVADSSSRGPSACDGSVFPKLVAPGVNIKTTDRTFGGIFPDSYAYVAGTSFAAPHVAGGMALLKSAFPQTTMTAIASALKESAQDLGASGPDNAYGYGFIDLAAAYNILLRSETACTDADNDGFYAETGCGTEPDCNDSDPVIYPAAPEIKHDGIDQDCNGYDLTIDILSAVYGAAKDTLEVTATSVLLQEAALALAGYGPMKWNRKTLQWEILVRQAGGNPGTVTVTGPEGSESALTSIN